MCKAESKDGICPKCGYCEHCGRGPQQVWPTYPPAWSWPKPWISISGTSPNQSSISYLSNAGSAAA